MKFFYISSQRTIHICWSLLCIILLVTAGIVVYIHWGQGQTVTYGTKRHPIILKDRAHPIILKDRAQAEASSDHHITTITPEQLDSVTNTTIQRNFIPVLVLAYMRSGSSVTADILQRHPGAFYVFEPLELLARMHGFPDIQKHGSLPDALTKEAVSFLRGIFKCDLESLRRLSQFKESTLLLSLKTSKYVDCLKQNYTESVNSMEVFEECLHYVRSLCLESKYRVIKTIRSPMSLAETLLEDLEELKIIHLVRDPRAILASWLRLNSCGDQVDGFLSCTKSICDRLLKDVAIKSYSRVLTNIMTVKYESLARTPVQTSRALYEYVGMEFLESVRDYVVNITSSPHDEMLNIWMTLRANSNSHIKRWRETLDEAQIAVINFICHGALKALKYAV